MRKVLITHDKCPDGLASAYVFKKKFGDDVEIIYSIHNHNWREQLSNINEVELIYFIDFCPKPEDFKFLLKYCDVKVIDHHKTALEETPLDLIEHCVFDMNECGSSLAWKNLFTTEMPIVLKYIKNGDLFKFNTIEDKYVNSYLLSKIDLESRSFDFFENFNKEEAIKVGKCFYEKDEIDAKYLASLATEIEIGGEKVLAVNNIHLTSNVGNLIAEKSKNDLALIYHIRDNEEVAFSVRGNRAGEFAKKMGGGGHPKAAGFRMSISDFLTILKKGEVKDYE
jgi:oligoribonuclease NrnB/cAMP/cGMP phosphodiesterase (DHH superfamily)